MKKVNLGAMKLHDIEPLNNSITVLRVPGGWIYYREAQGTFVPETVNNNAIEACKKIIEFSSECTTGYSLESNGKQIDLTSLNNAYDLAWAVLQEK
jgi:hypothetical protein